MTYDKIYPNVLCMLVDQCWAVICSATLTDGEVCSLQSVSHVVFVLERCCTTYVYRLDNIAC